MEYFIGTSWQTLWQRPKLAPARVNDNIPNDELQNSNEKEINTIYFKLMRWGMDSLSVTDIAFIRYLAAQCPYVHGSAVYKARALNAMYDPLTMFDDMDICNSVGVYKTSGGGNSNNQGIFTIENDYLKGVKIPISKEVLKEKYITIYPNPTTDEISILHDNDNTSKCFRLYDMFGRELMSKKLSNNTNLHKISLRTFASGMYTYSILLDGMPTFIGKIIKD